MSVTITSVDCPKCETCNWVNQGDASDMTAPDIEAVRCWQCGQSWWVDDEYRDTHNEGDDPADYADDGLKTPNEAL
jgi:hypothetical protein